MKAVKVVCVLVILFVAASCSERKAPNGMKMNVVREGAGEFGKPTEFLVVNMLYKDSKDSVWNDTRKNNVPIVIPIADASREKDEKGIESCFRVLKKGDSVEVTVTAQSLFVDTWKTQVPPTVKAEEKITFQIGVKDITDQAGFAKIQEEIQIRQMEEMRKSEEAQLGADTTAIDAYLAANNIKALKDASGLRYVISKHGKGANPSASQTVKVNYRGTLLENGTEFDKSTSPLELPLTSFIRGWQIGFPLLNKGSKATFYVPSSLAYGAGGYPPVIPGNANLVFEVELLDFK